jgi:hypothetical protein
MPTIHLCVRGVLPWQDISKAGQGLRLLFINNIHFLLDKNRKIYLSKNLFFCLTKTENSI